MHVGKPDPTPLLCCRHYPKAPSIYIYIHAYIHIYIYTCIYIHIYTHRCVYICTYMSYLLWGAVYISRTYFWASWSPRVTVRSGLSLSATLQAGIEYKVPRLVTTRKRLSLSLFRCPCTVANPLPSSVQAPAARAVQVPPWLRRR